MMDNRNIFAIWVATVLSVCSASSITIPTFPLAAVQDEVFAVTNALRDNGLLAIEMPNEYVATRNFALNGMCSCWNSLSEARSVSGDTMNGLLQQGSRTTVATATAGSTPLPLPTEISEICGQDIAEALDAMRDQVAVASQAFVSTWDQSMSPSHTPLLRTKHGVVYHRIHDIVEASTNLEHFHLYAKTHEEDDHHDDIDDLTVHTDAGLFLSFVPALDCTNGGDSAFWVEDHNGVLQQIHFPENAVIIMMGAGAEHWLQQSSVEKKVKATRHAVRMNVGTTRAWYGMMHLVPVSAIVQEYPEPRTLADLQQALVHTRSEATLQQRYQDDIISMGCGSVPYQEHSMTSVMTTSSASPRRRLAMVDNASVCNNATNFYCWMSCLDIPDVDHAQDHMESGHGLYCVDPSIMATTNNVSQAMEPCIGENGLPGSAMNSACIGTWQPKVHHLASVPVNVDTSNLPASPYCYGGSTMFHNGFQWNSMTCVVFLFPTWVLSSQGKFVAACFATILLGLLVEFILYQRRRVMKYMAQSSSRFVRLTVSAMIYGFQLTMGYVVMLVVMIYSAPLFVCVIVGLVLGHVLFNAKDAVFSLSSPTILSLKTKEGSDEEEEEGGTEGDRDGSQPRSEVENVEGITPCCQHTM